MKNLVIIMMCLLAVAIQAPANETENAAISELAVRGNIEDENISFNLSFKIHTHDRNTKIPLVSGDVAHIESVLPRNAVLSREGNIFYVTIPSHGKYDISFNFASRAIKDESWRQTSFSIPTASIRKLSVTCDRDDLEIVFPGALDVNRDKNKDQLTEVTAFLGVSEIFSVRWKPLIKKLDGELVVTCDANTIASASVGALKIDNIYMYRVAQGALKKISMEIPEGISVTQVKGEDIQDWLIENSGSTRLLNVTLSRPKDSLYRLQVESEASLPEFPCKMNLPVIIPRDVIRSSGFLMIGTDSAIKILVTKALGLTQVDQTAFPATILPAAKDAKKAEVRRLPSRSKFAYQYANTPYTLELSADDIVSEYNSDERMVISLNDDDLVFTASLELDVRDAPAREIIVETSQEWIVANVSGKTLSDYDVKDNEKQRLIHLHFREAILGPSLVDIRLERSMADKQESFTAPVFKVTGAKSERGYLVVAAEKGLRLTTTSMEGLREVLTGSVETRVAGAQHAYRFKQGDWKLAIGVERTEPTIHSEMFNLVSIGEGVLYCSAVVTYHIEGAPVRNLKFKIPETFKNVEFAGQDIRGRDHEGEIWTVTLQEKVIGDYTLGFTYDRKFDDKGETVSVGGVQTIETTSESGYIVLASSASLNLGMKSSDESIIAIDHDEIPQAYALLVNDPILKGGSYKYVGNPHVAQIDVQRFETEQLLEQVADHTDISTTISEDGEAVTTIIYSIKNLSKQHLSVELPGDANLWSTRILDQNGTGQDVTALKEKDRILVPISRLLNPNLPVRVELKYAETKKNLGWTGRTLKFKAPVTEETHSTFAQWTFTAPDGYAIATSGGNMRSENVSNERGIIKLLKKILKLGVMSVTTMAGWLFLFAALVGCVCLTANAKGRGKSRTGYVSMSVVVVGILTVLTAAMYLDGGISWLGKFLDVFRFGAHSPASLTITRTISLAASDPLFAGIRIAPSWMGAHVSLFYVFISTLSGLFILRKRHDRAAGNSTIKAIGLTLLTIAVTEFALGRTLIVLAIVLIIPLLLLITLTRKAYTAGCRKKDDVLTFETKENEAFPFEPIPENGHKIETEKDDRNSGGILPLLLLVACLATTFSMAEEQQVQQIVPATPNVPVLNFVTLSVTAPEMNNESEKSAKITADLKLKFDNTGTFLILNSPAVLTDYKLDSRDLSIMPVHDGYALVVEDEGEYNVQLIYSTPVSEQSGKWSLMLDIPANLGNKVSLTIPEAELDISSTQAVMLKKSDKDKSTEATLVYGSATTVDITWQSRARKTKLEDVVFFSEVNSIAVFQPGVVELSNLIHYQIAQGELKSMKIGVPSGMSITAVNAPGLSTWRFDPETGLLEAILENPVSGDFTVHVISQVGCDGLPYNTKIGTLNVMDTSRQRGSLAFAAPDTVQITVNRTDGLNPMNIEDVAPETLASINKVSPLHRQATIKRAFRYHGTPVLAEVEAEEVLPELRITEDSSLSVSDERVILSSRLTVMVSKAGIFSLKLNVPDGFDVETLTGQDISHWDELTDKERSVVIHFTKQVMDTRNINIVIARTEKGIEDTILVPKISVENALKHTGKLIISGERGVRMTTIDRKSVSDINPRDLDIREQGVLAYKILRPDWQITLKTDIVSATIRSEVLQKVDLSEGMLQCTAFIRYKIDHAGSKTFVIQAPEPGISLTVTGDDIAKVNETDKKKGEWIVELRNKVENSYTMIVRYQIPGDAGKNTVKILPLRTLDVESQKGYLVVMSGGRVQVKPTGSLPGLKVENSRSIPGYFGAGNLADAIYCYRTISGDYELNLSAIRHNTAEVLPAHIQNVNMVSVLTVNGEVLTKVELGMMVGKLSHLELTLPDKEASLWTAFVKGKAAAVSRVDDKYRIALGEPIEGEITEVEFVYASCVSPGWISGKQLFEGPRFNLPLHNLEWNFYVQPGRRYHAFGGTMQHHDDIISVDIFDKKSYAQNNMWIMEQNRTKAKSIMAESEQLVQKGEQKRARKALQSAINYAQNDNDQAFNEDARIQFKNLAEQQAVVGLVQRRDEMRYNMNIQEEGQMQRIEEFNGGNFTAEYANKIQQQLSDRDNSGLMLVAGKILDQQVAAERITQAINITMPAHGKRLRFTRSLQIQPNAEMTVIFKASDKFGGGILSVLFSAGLMFAFYRFFLLRRAN